MESSSCHGLQIPCSVFFSRCAGGKQALLGQKRLGCFVFDIGDE